MKCVPTLVIGVTSMSGYEIDSTTYRIHLREESPSEDVTSPLTTSRIDYYDSGIWVHREEDRLFLPYHQIQLIREGTESEEESNASEESDEYDDISE